MFKSFKDLKKSIHEEEYILLNKLYAHVFFEVQKIISDNLKKHQKLSDKLKFAAIEGAIR